MKTILRNLFYTLKRFRTASLLNLIGLSVSFAAFILIMMKVSHERNFDTCYPEADRIAVLNIGIDNRLNELIVMPRPFVERTVAETPAIECGAFFNCSPDNSLPVSTTAEQPQYIYELITEASRDFARVLNMEFVAGNDAGLRQTGGAIISESQAKKLFPDGNAVGSYLYMPQNKKLLVSGVYKDFPENAQFPNNIYRDIDEQKDKDNWGTQSYYAIVRMKPGVGIETLNQQLAASRLTENMSIYMDNKLTVCAMPIRDVYYHAEPWIFYKVGNRQHTWLLIAIAILTIGIAAVNLINFSTALTPMRIRSINTQKILGSSIRQLRLGLMLETIAVVLIGWLLSLFIVWSLTHLKLLSLMDFTPSFRTYLPVVLSSGSIALLTGLAAGLYPAWYMTSFPPALMLKGNYALSAKGRLLRSLLTSFQYIVSFTLLVCTGFIWLQNQKMKTQDTGFERDEILIAELPSLEQDESRFVTLEHELRKYPDIKGIAYASDNLGSSDVYSMTSSEYQKESFHHFDIRVSTDFGQVMGFKLLAGRFFQPSDTASSSEVIYCLATKPILDRMQIPTGIPFKGNYWKDNCIAGYIDDVIFTSSRINSFTGSPFLFSLEGQRKELPYCYIRIAAGANPITALRHVRETAEKIFTGYPIEVNFFNTNYQRLYKKETNQQYMVTLFSLLAIIISLVGVFGLTIFETEHRRKEIGIRKVYGACTRDILWNFNRTHLRTIVVCSAIASPTAWYFMNEWLQNFTIRISLSPWVFLAAFAIITLLVLTTVTIQNYRAATANPIDSLKTE